MQYQMWLLVDLWFSRMILTYDEFIEYPIPRLAIMQ